MFPRTDKIAGAAAWAPAALYLLTVALLGRQTVGDGYDGVGFVLAIDAFDLVRFQPQPPGYPLLVALGRLIHACGIPAAAALALVNAGLLGAGIAACAGALRRAAGSPVAVLWSLLLALSPLCWALAIATLSDGAGLGALLLALSLLAQDRPAALRAAGLVCAAALGLRPPYAPLVFMLIGAFGIWRGWRKMAHVCLFALIGTLLWLVPFSWLVGPADLWRLSTAHLRGHFNTFGGPALAEPATSARVLSLISGLWEAALGPCALLAGILLGLALWIRPPRQLPSSCVRLIGSLLAALAIYAVWAMFGLSVSGPARHLLPAVVMLVALLAVVMGQALQVQGSGRARALLAAGVGLLSCLLGISSARSIWAFRQPSPGAALADYVAAHHPPGTLLYGAAAARFLDLHWGSGSAHQTRLFGDILVEAERLDRLPAEVLLTSEVQAASAHRLRTLAKFCFHPLLPAALRFEIHPSQCVELRSYRFER